MKLTCLQENLSEGIRATGHLASRATNLPILNNVLLKATNAEIILLSTNLEAGIHSRVRGKVEEEGEVLIPARLLLELLPLLSEGPMTLMSSAGGIQVKTERTSTTIRSLPTAEFPIIPTLDGEVVECEVNQEELVEALESVGLAAGKVGDRPQFNGVCFIPNPKGLICVATDGYRLAETILPTKAEGMRSRAILPLLVAQEVSRVLKTGSERGTITLRFSETQVEVHTPATTIISRLIDGEYPDYTSLFPEAATTTATVLVNELAKAMKASTLFSRAGMSDVALLADPATGAVTVGAENSDVGAHENAVTATGTGPAVRIVLNARYILDGLSVIHSPKATLLITAPDRPILLVPEPQSAFRYLIMPIRQ